MKKFLTTTIVIVVLAAGGYAVYLSYQERFLNFISNYDRSCITNEEETIVRGDSLKDVINNGDTVKILHGYYHCNPVKRGDIIAYDYSGQPELIIKIASGLPGDRFFVRMNEGDDFFSIMINDAPLANLSGEQYKLSEAKRKMLSLYENDYKGVIPEDTYLILGNQINGSLDSTRFGLVSKKGIIGKVIAEKTRGLFN